MIIINELRRKSLSLSLLLLFFCLTVQADVYDIDSIDKLYVTNPVLAQIRIDSLRRRCERDGYKTCTRGHLEVVYSLIMTYRHQPAQAIRHAHQAYVAAKEDNDYLSLLTALQLLADSELKLGFNRLALEHINTLWVAAEKAPSYCSRFFIPTSMSLMSEAYARSGNIAKALDLLSQALKFSAKSGNSHSLYYEFNIEKAQCYIDAKNYRSAEHIFKMLLISLDSGSKTLRGGMDKTGYDITFLDIYSQQALLDLKLNNPKQAEQAYTKACALYAKYSDVPDVRTRMAQYLSLAGRNDELIHFVEPLINTSVQSKQMLQLMQMLLHSYLDQNQLDKAKRLYTDYVALEDTIKIRDSDCALEEMNIAYHTYDLQKKLDLRTSYLISTLVILLLFIFIIIATVFYSRKLKRLYRSARERVDEFVERQAKMELLRNSKAISESANHQFAEFTELDKRIKLDKPYLDSTFGRDALAAYARMDKNTLNEVVKQGAKVTPSKYINQLRIVHAVELLHSKPEYSIESIAADAGFGNRTTFYRVFSDIFGITPVQYRKQQHFDFTEIAP